MTDEKLTIKEAAIALGVHPSTVRRRIRDNKIEYEKDEGPRGQYYIPASAIDTFRTTKDIIIQTREIDVTGLTNEIYEQRVAVIKLFERIGDMHISEIEGADQIRDISKKLEKVNAKIDKLTESVTSREAKYREYWWQFWLPEKP